MIKRKMLALLTAASVMIGGVYFTSCSNDDDETPTTIELDSTPAATVAGTVYVNETYSISSASVTNEGTSIKIEQVTDSSNTVNITLPGCSYSDSMTIPSFKIENVVVSTTDNEKYTFSLGTFTQTVTVDDAEKTITGTSVSGTWVKSTEKISLTAVYQYGSMPVSGTDTFTNNWESSYSSDYSISDLVGNGYTFTTGSGPHTFSVVSDSEIVYKMEVTSISKTFYHYITYTSQEVGKNVYLVTGYTHDSDPLTPATSGTASVYRVEITAPDTAILLLASKTEATKTDVDEGTPYSAYYGTYTGTWTVLNNPYDMTVIVAESTLYYASTQMTGSYEYVGWEKDDDGNWVCCGSHTEGKATVADAATTVTFKDGKGYFSVVAMASLASPAEITKSSDSTEIPTDE